MKARGEKEKYSRRGLGWARRAVEGRKEQAETSRRGLTHLHSFCRRTGEGDAAIRRYALQTRLSSRFVAGGVAGQAKACKARKGKERRVCSPCGRYKELQRERRLRRQGREI